MCRGAGAVRATGTAGAPHDLASLVGARSRSTRAGFPDGRCAKHDPSHGAPDTRQAAVGSDDVRRGGSRHIVPPIEPLRPPRARRTSSSCSSTTSASAPRAPSAARGRRRRPSAWRPDHLITPEDRLRVAMARQERLCGARRAAAPRKTSGGLAIGRSRRVGSVPRSPRRRARSRGSTRTGSTG